LSGARSDYQIEKQVDSMDLCPLFDKLVARSSREVVEVPLVRPPIEPIPLTLETKSQETKSSLLNLKSKLNLKK
jgi:hypothetical protein